MLFRFFAHFCLNLLALFLAARWVPGIAAAPENLKLAEIEVFPTRVAEILGAVPVLTTFVGAAIVFGFLNTFLKPIMKILSFPVMIPTLGAFIFVINAAVLLILSQLWPSYAVADFRAGFFGALLISAVHFVGHFFLKK